MTNSSVQRGGIYVFVLERSPTVISYCLDCLTVIFSIAASLFELSAGGQYTVADSNHYEYYLFFLFTVQSAIIR